MRASELHLNIWLSEPTAGDYAWLVGHATKIEFSEFINYIDTNLLEKR